MKKTLITLTALLLVLTGCGSVVPGAESGVKFTENEKDVASCRATGQVIPWSTWTPGTKQWQVQDQVFLHGGDTVLVRKQGLGARVGIAYNCSRLDQRPFVPVTESKHVFVKNYSLAVERSAYVGEPIVKVKDYYEVSREADTLAASESFGLALEPTGHADVAAGTIGEIRDTTTRRGKTYRLAQIKERTLSGLYFLLNDDGSFEGSALDGSGHQKGSSYHPNPSTVRFLGKPLTSIDASKGFVNFELIYSGVTKDSITVFYREYTREDLARPAYSQNLVYPKDSTTIRFREIGIAVREASNERLRYVVQADGLK